MVDQGSLNELEKVSHCSEFLSLEFGPFETVHRWKRMPECDEFVGARRSKHTVVSYKDGIYVFGGDNGKVMLNDLLRFDVKEKSWGCAFSIGTPPSPRYHHSAVVHDSSMFVFGGFTGDIQGNSNLRNQNDLFEYKFQSCQWVEWEFSGKAPVPRAALGAAVYDNKLWIFAGYDGNSRLNDMWTIDLKGSNVEWEEIKQLGDCPPTCCNFPLAVAGDCLYVFSGQSGAKFTNSLYYFEFKDKCWSRITHDHFLNGGSPLPSRRYGHTMVSFGRCLYVFGGAADSALPNELYCFDLDTNTWSVITPSPDSEVPSGRLFHASAIVGDAMYVFGGTVYNNVRSGDMYRFQIPNYPKCTLCDDFGGILRKGLFVDLELLVGPEEEKISTHIPFVAARSQYLKDMILEAMQHKPQEVGTGSDEDDDGVAADDKILQIKLPDANPVAMKLILNYIYTDKINTAHYTESGDVNQMVLIMMDVYCLAAKFLMPRLEYLCVVYLESKICIENVLLVLSSASKLNFYYIQAYCIEFIIRENNYSQVIMTSEFEEIDKKLMVEIIRRKNKLLAALLPPAAPNPTSMEKTLQKDMEQFLKTDGYLFCDVSLVVDHNEIPAHKSILAARCSYFEAMFRSFMPKEGKVQLTFGNIVPSRQSAQSLLNYIYYGDVNMPPEDALYLFSAPLFFGFTNNRIRAFCRENLERKIKTENLIPILAASDRIQAWDLKKHLLHLIVRDFPKVSNSGHLQNLNKNLLLDILHSLASDMNESRLCSDLSASSFHSD